MAEATIQLANGTESPSLYGLFIKQRQKEFEYRDILFGTYCNITLARLRFLRYRRCRSFIEKSLYELVEFERNQGTHIVRPLMVVGANRFAVRGPREAVGVPIQSIIQLASTMYHVVLIDEHFTSHRCAVRLDNGLNCNEYLHVRKDQTTTDFGTMTCPIHGNIHRDINACFNFKVICSNGHQREPALCPKKGLPEYVDYFQPFGTPETDQ